MADLVGFCFKCQTKLELMQGFSRREDCPKCGADIHCCYNCKFYDQGSYNECKETTADVVKEKDRANFCDYFLLNEKNGAAEDKVDDLKAAAEALFKK